MSNHPQRDEDRRQSALMARRYAAVRVPTPTGYRWVEPLPDDAIVQDAEVLPFTEPLFCPRCNGDLAALQITKHRRGKIVVAVTEEIVVCPRCAGGVRR